MALKMRLNRIAVEGQLIYYVVMGLLSKSLAYGFL